MTPVTRSKLLLILSLFIVYHKTIFEILLSHTKWIFDSRLVINIFATVFICRGLFSQERLKIYENRTVFAWHQTLNLIFTIDNNNYYYNLFNCRLTLHHEWIKNRDKDWAHRQKHEISSYMYIIYTLTLIHTYN